MTSTERKDVRRWVWLLVAVAGTLGMLELTPVGALGTRDRDHNGDEPQTAPMGVPAAARATSSRTVVAPGAPWPGGAAGFGPAALAPGSAVDRGRVVPVDAPAARASTTAPAGPSDRGHAFVRGARGFSEVVVPGATFTAASRTNDGGRIVGIYRDARRRFHGFLRDGRSVRRIDFPGAEGTLAAGIDDRGRIVGSYTDERGTPVIRSFEHGFLLDERGRFRRIDVPGATETRPAAINDRGQIAGEYVDGAGRSHGYLQDTDGSVTTIDPPGAGASVVTDVDDRGRVIGGSVDAAQTTISAFVCEPDGRFTTIANPDAGFYGTAPQGINNKGQIAGIYTDANNRPHGFVLDNGTYTTVDAPDAPGNTQVLDIDDRGRLVGVSGPVSYGYLTGGRGQPLEIDAPRVVSDTFPAGINNRGYIVGSSDRGAAKSYHGFLRDRRGRFQRIDYPGAKGTAAARINEHGDIVGYYSTSTDNPNTATDVRGFLRSRRGRFTEIDVPDAILTQPTGINDRSEIVGTYADANGAAHGFLRDQRGRFTKIDVPDAIATLVFDLNDRGQVVGSYIDTDGKLRGFRRNRSGDVTTIDAPGAIQTRVRGINNRGQIAIDTVDAQLVHHSYLLDQGRFTEITPHGAAGNGTLATDLDDHGHVLGYVI